MIEPTNQQLLEMLEGQNKRLSLIEGQLPGLATKQDIAEVLKFMKSIYVGVGVVRFSWNNASKIGNFLLLCFGGYIFFKLGAVGVINWARQAGFL